MYSRDLKNPSISKIRLQTLFLLSRASLFSSALGLPVMSRIVFLVGGQGRRCEGSIIGFFLYVFLLYHVEGCMLEVLVLECRLSSKIRRENCI